MTYPEFRKMNAIFLLKLTLETWTSCRVDAICLFNSIIPSWRLNSFVSSINDWFWFCTEKLISAFSWKISEELSWLLIRDVGLVLFLCWLVIRSFLLLWYVDSFEDVWTNNVFGLSRDFSPCLFIDIELLQEDVSGPDQQVFLVWVMLESCWSAFVACTVSFKALTPLLIDDGSLAEDLPRIPPRITSSVNFDRSEIQNKMKC